ncbi:TAXI family TRAP transporter solute-binding subunit [Saccharothrix coeruleofusca]|uniref:C4-dicarboxylate ABC transporter substrate-binding protein n=1 Tax=Saccharothrix coeruleofusca TaxID=33919 RepID=A0A918AL03_9PSEU|nr:TAXI family TRAP transporter solute-binding subunit [Saccharothrix coeruleofusca]MBP2334470.1 TRAP transporter TAXI family solute receptor [Saccharothrix coeruleofusca]GGP40811.1 C4-dicarboxylate ABC transporter substrate-binding protein [Saccharothrix coeruleofusca]
MSGTLLRVHALGAALAVAALSLTACGDDFDHVKLTVAAGVRGGVYHQLSTALAEAWAADPGVERPQVAETRGSVDNLTRLRTGQAQVGFSAADAADDELARSGPGHRLYALARMHDDYLQLIVRDDVQATKLADLRGKRVSIGAVDSGVILIAQRLLESAGLSTGDLQARHLDPNDSAEAMRRGELDAFFWSGGVPTHAVTELAETVPVRMLDLGDVLPDLRDRYPIYGSATLPASAYQLPGGPITTLVVRNFLLVTDQMSAEVAEALLRGLFRAQPALVAANPVARSIEVRSAIETTPVELHPGAVRYYRDVKV